MPFRSLLLVITFVFMLCSLSWGADVTPPAVFTQKDFARMILEQFEWSKGLPQEPADRDYLLILGGKRTFRYEAENSYNPATDRVTVRNFPKLGEFTGSGWLLGVSDETNSTFTILLPVSGEYEFKAVLKGTGFVWNIDGKEYRADVKGENFLEVSVAKVRLNAGPVTIKLTIPPEGAIDSYSLTASDHIPIQPFYGWRFRDALTAVRLAEIAVAMTDGYSRLPDDERSESPQPVAVFEKSTLNESVTATDISYLGPFTSAKWLRADFRGTTIKIPIAIAKTGYYAITLNAAGEVITGRVNDTAFKVTGKPFLEKHAIGLFRLEEGDNTVTLALSPLGGIDSIEFNKKRATSEDFLRIAGVQGPPDRLVGPQEAAAFIKTLQGSFSTRK